VKLRLGDEQLGYPLQRSHGLLRVV
jgi:hypothetical protein